MEIKDDVKLHLQESSIMQKQWINYVFEIIEKLHAKIDTNVLQVQKEREEVFRSLMELKEKLNDRINSEIKEQYRELKELEKKVNCFMEDSKSKVSELSNGVASSIDKCTVKYSKAIDDFAKEIRQEIKEASIAQQEINKRLTDELLALSEAQTKVQTKVGVYVTFVSIITTTIIGILATSLLVIFKDVLKAWLG